MLRLEAQNITKKYSRHLVFEALSFEYEKGVLGIAGSNGSGKSTLLKCLAGLSKVSNGRLQWVEENNPLPFPLVKKKCGYAAPYINLYPELSVLENLQFLLKVSNSFGNLPGLKYLLEKVQVPGLADQLYGSLSTGQQQRVKLAAALVKNPDILILDEPGSNLDTAGHELVCEITRDAKAEGTLVIIASNDSREIDLCDQVIRLQPKS